METSSPSSRGLHARVSPKHFMVLLNANKLIILLAKIIERGHHNSSVLNDVAKHALLQTEGVDQDAVNARLLSLPPTTSFLDYLSDVVSWLKTPDQYRQFYQNLIAEEKYRELGALIQEALPPPE